MTNSYIR